MTEPLVWMIRKPNTIEQLGGLVGMLSPADPDPAAKQFDKHYSHGGGWRPFKGHTLSTKDGSLTYPGDEPLKPIALCMLRDEIITVYPYSWVCVFNKKDGTYEVCRMD